MFFSLLEAHQPDKQHAAPKSVLEVEPGEHDVDDPDDERDAAAHQSALVLGKVPHRDLAYVERQGLPCERARFSCQWGARAKREVRTTKMTT